MGRQKRPAEAAGVSSATVGYEAQLWQMADALRGSMDAAEYKHVVLGACRALENRIFKKD